MKQPKAPKAPSLPKAPKMRSVVYAPSWKQIGKGKKWGIGSFPEIKLVSTNHYSTPSKIK